ncbi:MarR family transcriptional regulator [Saccharothrix sp. ALI-22-I]|uniref:MarR family winged helix-turn-helix transcriptional regulator n=1 Tax=Saccharothrix sp. ALI-22-I TaxID=1933778 RepID=UPI00097C66AE|nr:MarR family transcriptional regulator [Saccharothrix sp. ALI-22-I]ONI84597.1 MarR family transcriptional regulator [Saccharothrix sp. ALI-22-I]
MARRNEDRVEPRWLSGDEQESWLPFASMLMKLPAALDAQLQRDSDITHFEYLVLARLSMTPGRTLRMSDLATTVSASLSRLSHVVKRLERRGWVRRAPCPENGRYTNATLTEAGWEKVVASAPGHVEEVRRLVVDALSGAELRQLRDISGRVLDRIDPDANPF